LIEGESINLFYLNSIEKKKIIKFADKRWIFSEKKLQNSTDRIKTQMALPANIIHAYDAKLARYLIKNVKCFTIHDSFGTSIFDIHQLMDFTNKYFNTELTAQTYGLFILI
jgi:DNA-directed RNA polymerase